MERASRSGMPETRHFTFGEILTCCKCFSHLQASQVALESAWQCRRGQRWGFKPWVWKIPWRRKWQPTPVFLPGESQGQRSLVGYSPRGHKELDSSAHTHTHTHTHRLKSAKYTVLTRMFWEERKEKTIHFPCIIIAMTVHPCLEFDLFILLLPEVHLSGHVFSVGFPQTLHWFLLQIYPTTFVLSLELGM